MRIVHSGADVFVYDFKYVNVFTTYTQTNPLHFIYTHVRIQIHFKHLKKMTASPDTNIHAYINIYIYIHIYVRTYIHTYTHTYIHTYMHTYKYKHTYIHTYTHTHLHTDKHAFNAYTQTQ